MINDVMMPDGKTTYSTWLVLVNELSISNLENLLTSLWLICPEFLNSYVTCLHFVISILLSVESFFWDREMLPRWYGFISSTR